MKKQKGLALGGFIVIMIIVVLLLILAFKVTPALIEYKSIQRQFKSMADDPTLRNASRATIDRAWAMRAAVEGFRAIDGFVVETEKEGDQLVVYSEYSVKVPLFLNTSACFDFKPSSKN
jgi:hypothetical protein